MSSLNYLTVVLVLLAVGGLAIENFSNYPLAILCLLGIAQIVREPRAMFHTGGARLLVAIFGCIWLPMLLSLPDAANPARAIKTTGLYPHYLFAGLYVIHILRDLAMRRIVLAGIAAVLGFWCIDGFIQLVTGTDLFGYPYDGSILKGAFYPKQRFGLVMAVFTPLFVHVVRRLASRSPAAWLLLVPYIAAIAFSLKRTAWIMLAAALAICLAGFFRPTRRGLRNGLLFVFVLSGALGLGAAFVPSFSTQLAGTMNIFSTDFESADVASSRRLSLWKTGLSVARAHWINGVGPRGYRKVYKEFAAADDFWISIGSTGQTHPHLMALEVLVETGVIGLLGYGLALWLLFVSLWAIRASDPASSAYLMVAVVAWFPMNAHLAFYGSYWSNIAWIAIALGCVGISYTAAAPWSRLRSGSA